MGKPEPPPSRKARSQRGSSTGSLRHVSANSQAENGYNKPGRRRGKHSNEDYTQTSIYLPIDLRNRVRAKLYEQGMEMSGLVEDMLRDWLARQR